MIRQQCDSTTNLDIRKANFFARVFGARSSKAQLNARPVAPRDLVIFLYLSSGLTSQVLKFACITFPPASSDLIFFSHVHKSSLTSWHNKTNGLTMISL